jgi:hypothetical protein
VTTPIVLRKGMLFETRLEVLPRRGIEHPEISITPSLWHETTINTVLPAGDTESYGAGGLRLAYPPLAAGERLEVKFDGQVNPAAFGGSRGEIGLYDGDRPLGTLPLHIRVLP